MTDFKPLKANPTIATGDAMKKVEDLDLPTNWKPVNNLAYIKPGTDLTVIVRESGWSTNTLGISMPYRQIEEHITLDAACSVRVIDEVDPGKFLCRYTGDDLIDNFMVVPFEALTFDEWSQEICTLQQRNDKVIDDVTQLLE
jgi:hypothetical protein